MNKQLILSIEELREMGFSERVYPAIQPNEIDPYGSSENTLMQIKTLNGCFSYNPNPKDLVYKWYHVTEIGNSANWVHLNIPNLATLELCLRVFKCEFESKMMKPINQH